MAHVRTYRSKVKVGNWTEDELLQKDAMQEYLEKKEKGELYVQKIDLLRQNMLQPVNLSVTTDGDVHFGDVVMLVNVGAGNRDRSAVSIDADVNSLMSAPSPSIPVSCGVSAGRTIQPCTRTAFIVTSVDGNPDGSVLHFEQRFALRTLSGFAKGANVEVLIVHCKTNQALAVLGDQVLWTTFGKEYEVTAHTFLDCHKLEEENNHWVLSTSDPAGNGLVLLNRQQ
ncbi:cilia- and flagella-associated protein 161 isoform X2 [Oryzias melastigma]|uniref:cilia- and flagella-associated protein 161 isoform X2 n=1 Tax=Oryzias melastigma TaxID=30732 RepID=UPI00168D77B8|nr:cilia- and flagella-associated protein 161 isoform X2 [Oryzias melastigma]